MSNVVFHTTDPTSHEWRKAWRRFVGSLLDPLEDELVYKIVKEVHHRGWRAGVSSVRREDHAPGSPRHYNSDERRAWERGAVAGRQSAQKYLREYNKEAKNLR